MAGSVDLDRKVAFNIPAQPLDTALIEFSKQAGVPVSVAAKSLHRIQSRALNGTLPADTALTALLDRSGLRFEAIGGTVTVVSGGPADVQSKTQLSTTDQTEVSDSPLAAAAKKSDVQTVGEKGTESTEGAPRQLEQVVVTAQKREERLQDVPVPVTAISADTLVENNQLRLQDYFAEVPGLNYTTDFRGAPSVSIRGLATATGFANPTVGIVVDDIPYGSSTGLGGGSSAPDIDPSDLERVEVLRGPQGTLYGANSLGGLLKFVTVDPSTDGVKGRVEADTDSVYNGAELGYGFRGSVNVPISDTWAVRASGFTREDPGYIDNVWTGQKGINRTDAEGGRLAALWRPTEDFSLKLGVLYQYSRQDGSNYVDELPGLGDLQQYEARNTGYVERRLQVYSATGTLKLGTLNVTSVTGYSINDINDSLDDSPILGAALAEPMFGVLGASLPDHSKTKKFSQEFRLSAPIGQSIDWLFGAFYTHEQSPYFQQLLAVDPITGGVAGNLGTFSYGTTFTEYAAFTDLTFHISDRFDIQAGGRESENRQTYHEIDTGPLVGGVAVQPEVETRDNSFTYLLTPRFRFSPDLMAYARLASGYRPGGPNSTCTVLNVPCEYGPDRTQNYELGIKGDLNDHVLDFDASLYYINWRDIQLVLAAPNSFEYFANGSRAKSQGVELSVVSRPLQGLKLAAWISWDDAVLTETLPSTTTVYGAAGDRLPYSSRISGNVSVDDDFYLTSGVTGFVGGSVSYVGDRLGTFTSPPPTVPPRQDLPGYARADIRAGARYQSWTVDVFVNNLMDNRGLLVGGIGTGFPSRFAFIQPRTVGLTISRSF
jgi:iron complex outermembrane receptor protein